MTAWVGDHPTASLRTVLYALVPLMDAIAYTLLQNLPIAVNGRDTAFGRAINSDRVSQKLPRLPIAAG